MLKRWSCLAVVMVLSSGSAAFAQLMWEPGNGTAPLTLIESAETRVVRVDMLPNTTRPMHRHPESLFAVFVTMDAPMVLTIQGRDEPVRLGPWQAYYLEGDIAYAFTNPNSQQIQFMEFFALKPTR